MATKTGLVDASGRPISPREIARARFRGALDAGGAQGWAYDAQAPHSQDMAGWNPGLRSPDSSINYSRDQMVARARDLINNDGWASGAINRLLDSAIGSHFLPIPQPNFTVLARLCPAMDATFASEFAAQVAAEWRMWGLDDVGRHNDAMRTQTITQQFRTAFRHKVVDGDAIGAILWAPERRGRYSTTVQTIEPDRLSNRYQAIDTHSSRGGVLIDDMGAPFGYSIRRALPFDWYDSAKSWVWDDMPRETDWGRPVVVHDFDKDRASQHRGIGLLTAVLPKFRMLHRFDQASLQAAVLRTMVGFFLKSPYDAQQIRDAMDIGSDAGEIAEQSWYQGLRGAYHDENPVTMAGVRMPTLAPGESIEAVRAGDQAVEFDAFEHAFLRCIAAATGQAVEEISGDFSKVNYSSFRGATLQAWRTLIRRRTDFASGYCSPIYAAWLEEALGTHLAGLLPRNAPDFNEFRAAYVKCMWIGPGKGWVDPVKERQGEVLGLDAGFGTLSQVCAEVSGAYWRDVLEQRAVEEAEMKRLKLTKPDWAGGMMQPAETDAARPQPV